MLRHLQLLLHALPTDIRKQLMPKAYFYWFPWHWIYTLRLATEDRILAEFIKVVHTKGKGSVGSKMLTTELPFIMWF